MVKEITNDTKHEGTTQRREVVEKKINAIPKTKITTIIKKGMVPGQKIAQ